MRTALLTLLTCALAVPPAGQSSTFFPVGIDYPPDARTASPEIARDLQAVRSAGFNTIKATISWRDGEPARGEYRFGALARTVEAAGRYGVRVILQIDRTPPAWVFARYPGASESGTAAFAGAACVDRPGPRADLLQFVSAAAKAASRSGSLIALDLGSPPLPGVCDLGGFVSATRAAVPARVSVNGHASRHSPLIGLAPDIPTHDEWLMAGAVDRYGMRLDSALPPADLSLAFAGVAAASRGAGWWFYSGRVPDSDRRFAAWMAIASGAKGLVFDDPPPDAGFVTTIARNPALFAQVRPRRSRVALVFDPSGSQSSAHIAPLHRALMARAVAADLIDTHGLSLDRTASYRALVIPSRPLAPEAADALKRFRAQGGLVIDGAAAQPERVVEQLIAGGVAPDVRLDGGSDIDVRFLESDDVQMIVALNYAEKAQRVTMTFPPETQEAVWLNLESGSSVNFVAGPAGPLYQYWFRPRDALVLMIRKDIR